MYPIKASQGSGLSVASTGQWRLAGVEDKVGTLERRIFRDGRCGKDNGP